MDNNELRHWGVKGMRWGVRRYQNKDGSLTPAGKKRYEQELADLDREAKLVATQRKNKAAFDRLDAKRKRVEDAKIDAGLRKKRVSEMSDSELRAHVERLQLEARYSQLSADTKSAGQKIIDSAWNNILKPELEGAARSIIKTGLSAGIQAGGSKIASEIKKHKK